MLGLAANGDLGLLTMNRNQLGQIESASGHDGKKGQGR
jgi:hypothetical protein